MKKITFILLCVFALCSCEKPILDDDTSGKGNVTLRFNPYVVSPDTISTESVSTYVSKLNLQLFKSGTEEKVFDKIKTQTLNDDNFGTFNFSVSAGDYDVLCVGHSSYNSATLNRNKVSFTAHKGKKITDTFWVMQKITVTDEGGTYDMDMERATAMFRLVLTDDIPEYVNKFKFEYSGCSADFNPWTGIGITNSSQSEIRYIDTDKLEIYTFPKGEGKLTVKVSALDATDVTRATKTFNDVPVQSQYITTYEGKFFDGEDVNVSGNVFNVTINGTWLGENKYTF